MAKETCELEIVAGMISNCLFEVWLLPPPEAIALTFLRESDPLDVSKKLLCCCLLRIDDEAPAVLTPALFTTAFVFTKLPLPEIIAPENDPPCEKTPVTLPYELTF